MKNKKGLMVRTIVILIVLLFSLGVVLLFYYMFDWYGEVDKQTCHQSVVYKATVPDAPVFNKKVVELPLKCETENICITTNAIKKGNCDEAYLGEKYTTVRIKSKNLDEEINQVIADKLAECWWMMGEGNLNIYSRDWDTLNTKKVCNICTRIAFSKEIRDEKTQFKGLKKYLTSHIVEGTDKTYWQYITNSEVNYINGYSEEEDFQKISQKAIVFYEIRQGSLQKLFPFGGAGVGFIVGSIVPGPGTLIGAGIGGAAGYFGGKEIEKIVKYFQDIKGGDVSGIGLYEYNIKELKELECTSF